MFIPRLFRGQLRVQNQSFSTVTMSSNGTESVQSTHNRIAVQTFATQTPSSNTPATSSSQQSVEALTVDPYWFFTGFLKLELDQWISAMNGFTSPCVHEINLVNGQEAASSALVVLLFISIAIQAFIRKLLIGMFIIFIPAMEGQANDMMVGIFFALQLPKGCKAFNPPDLDFGFDPNWKLKKPKIDRLFWLNGIAEIVLDSVMRFIMIAYAITRGYYHMWQLVVFLLICFSTHAVVIGWICHGKLMLLIHRIRSGHDKSD